MLAELARAVDAADWPRALVLALDAWRATRAPVLADLVDRIAARCPYEDIPREGEQRTWLARARTYDPLDAIPLLANARELGRRTGVENKLRQRLAVLATWPDDPRVAQVLAAWFADANIGWRYAHEAATIVFYQHLAAQLTRLRDVRAIPHLERVLAEPPGAIVGLRESQRTLATNVLGVLAETALETPLANAGEIARWCPSPAPLPATLDERALWRDAAAAEDARLVLADYLLERGDRRGEIITLACAGTAETAHESSALLHAHWERWMGDLALVLDRGNCSFVRGLLDIATIGIYSSPEWAYPKVATHRELATIRIVRPGWNASDKGYVAFLNALPDLPSRVGLTATMIEPFARARTRWPVRELELRMNLPDLPLAPAIRLAATAMPDVEQIDVPMPSEIDAHVISAIREMQRHFPRLARVRVDASRWIANELRAALVELAQLPFVEIDHGRFH